MTGEEFKAWRKRMGWTQAETATALEISEPQVRNYEKGRFPVTKLVELACEALESRTNEKRD